MRYINRVKYSRKYSGVKKVKNKSGKYESLTEKEISTIRIMLLGPFQLDWYNKDNIVDNRDRAISTRTDLPLSLVRHCTSKILKEKECERLLMREFLECKVCNRSSKTCKKHKYIINKLSK